MIKDVQKQSRTTCDRLKQAVLRFLQLAGDRKFQLPSGLFDNLDLVGYTNSNRLIGVMLIQVSQQQPVRRPDILHTCQILDRGPAYGIARIFLATNGVYSTSGRQLIRQIDQILANHYAFPKWYLTALDRNDLTMSQTKQSGPSSHDRSMKSLAIKQKYTTPQSALAESQAANHILKALMPSNDQTYVYLNSKAPHQHQPKHNSRQDHYCPHCGASCRPGDNYCTWCGAKLK